MIKIKDSVNMFIYITSIFLVLFIHYEIVSLIRGNPILYDRLDLFIFYIVCLTFLYFIVIIIVIKNFKN